MIIQDFGVLAIPTVPGPPPKLQTEATSLESFRARAFSLLSIAGVSGFCQVLCVWVFVLRHENLAFSMLVYVKTFGKPHDFFLHICRWAYHWGCMIIFLWQFPCWRNMAQMGSCKILLRLFMTLLNKRLSLLREGVTELCLIQIFYCKSCILFKRYKIGKGSSCLQFCATLALSSWNI